MNPELESIRRGQCPNCTLMNIKHWRTCARCGKQVCEDCWIGGKVACLECQAQIEEEGYADEREWRDAA